MKPTACFPIRKNGDSMTSSARTGKRERISSLHRIGAVMCELNLEMSAVLATSVTSLRLCSLLGEALGRGEAVSQLVDATWKLRSLSPLKTHTTAQLGLLLCVV